MQIDVVENECVQYFLDQDSLRAKQLALLPSQLLPMGNPNASFCLLSKLIAKPWMEDVYQCLVPIFRELLPHNLPLCKPLLALGCRAMNSLQVHSKLLCIQCCSVVVACVPSPKYSKAVSANVLRICHGRSGVHL